MKKYFLTYLLLFLSACVHQYNMPTSFEFKSVDSNNKTLATWQKISDDQHPIHIYVEGDGHAFYANGRPTPDPTPQNSFVRKLAATDTAPNVVYIARPCQFISDSNCDVSDWTNARFSQNNVNSMAGVIKQFAKNKPIIIIGYSGGALLTGLAIKQNPDIKVQKWITIAGVLNHHDWTEYFGDEPLDKSLDMDTLPNVHQIHYVGERDSVVPVVLSKKWIDADKIKIIPNANHNDFTNLELDFN